jgi:predicted PurR-regulated permease PerM
MSKIFFWLALLTGFFVLFYLLKGVLLPFAAGLVIAYFLDPLADWFESKGFSRSISTGAVTLISLTLFILVILILFPIMKSHSAIF